MITLAEYTRLQDDGCPHCPDHLETEDARPFKARIESRIESLKRRLLRLVVTRGNFDPHKWP